MPGLSVAVVVAVSSVPVEQSWRVGLGEGGVGDLPEASASQAAGREAGLKFLDS